MSLVGGPRWSQDIDLAAVGIVSGFHMSPDVDLATVILDVVDLSQNRSLYRGSVPYRSLEWALWIY